eukprot:96990-Rhodomonas_salina.2
MKVGAETGARFLPVRECRVCAVLSENTGPLQFPSVFAFRMYDSCPESKCVYGFNSNSRHHDVWFMASSGTDPAIPCKTLRCCFRCKKMLALRVGQRREILGLLLDKAVRSFA